MAKGMETRVPVPCSTEEVPLWRKLDEEFRKRECVGRKQPSQRGNAKQKRERAKRKTRQQVVTPEDTLEALSEAFAELTDPRVNRRRRHLLIDVVVIAVCAVTAGAESWKGMALWGETQLTWLQRFLKLPNGIPSRDTFRRVISRVDPTEFQTCFLSWLRGATRTKRGKVVAIDGKTLRRSMDSEVGRSPVHVVSAWATEQHLTLGQCAVDSKSNEITAIPELLRLLHLKGSVVTIDAMGCQKAIAEQIIAQKADYCLAVKGNQEHLFEDITEHFDRCLDTEFAGISHDCVVTEEKSHGRLETRYYYTTDIPESVRSAEAWAGLKSLGMAISQRITKSDSQFHIRYYINSFASDAQRFADATRSHWAIENSLHWIMDVTFQEDACRIRKEHGGENFSWLRRFAISLLKNESTVNDTIRAKRYRAGWDVQYLEAVLVAAATSN